MAGVNISLVYVHLGISVIFGVAGLVAAFYGTREPDYVDPTRPRLRGAVNTAFIVAGFACFLLGFIYLVLAAGESAAY